MERACGMILIDCIDAQHMNQVHRLMGLIVVPLAELGLGRRTVLRAPGVDERFFPLEKPFIETF